MSLRDRLLSHARLDDEVLIAGIVECREVLKMEKEGLIEIIAGSVTPHGGSGIIKMKAPAQ